MPRPEERDTWAPMELRERPDDHLNLVVNSLRRITQAIRLSSSAAHEALGVTGAQLFVLQQLAERPGASLREVAERTLTDQSSVSVRSEERRVGKECRSR